MKILAVFFKYIFGEKAVAEYYFFIKWLRR